MKNIVQEFTKPVNLVVDTYDGTFSVVRACMLLHKHRKFIGCEVDPCCVTGAMPWLILLYAQQMFSIESDIDREEEARSSAKLYVRAVNAIKFRKCLDVCKVPERLLPVRTFLPHILYLVNTYFGDGELLRKSCNIPARQCSEN